MSDLPWDAFLALPGDARKNWEVLCRELVRRHYERYGPLLSRKQQPGVEFHLAVQRESKVLGEPGRHWGWQCKWYEADAFRQDGSQLLAVQRKRIEDAIAKSAEYVPGLTDWVLWTREKLSAEDARWLAGLSAPFTLRHWDEETTIGMLSGSAEVLRRTWFGESVLTEEMLTENRRLALAPIAQRYQEELHIRTPPQARIEMMLPDEAFVATLKSVEADLERRHLDLMAISFVGTVDEETAEVLRGVALVLKIRAAQFAVLSESFASGEVPDGEAIKVTANEPLPSTLQRALSELKPDRRRRVPDLDRALRHLQEVEQTLTSLATGLLTPLVAIVGRAGAGKTHLAADLTGADEAAGGVLVLGSQFGAEIDDREVDRLVALTPDGKDLLEALEAVGIREGRRVPLIIDGLNESDEPSKWKVALARLAERLTNLPHVLGVVTLRPSYRDFVLPDGLEQIDIEGFVGVEEDAISRYFDYYRIRADPQALNWWRPSDPLLLAIFCRTVNPDRVEEVNATQLPGSLHEVFDTYLQEVCKRVAEALKIEATDVAAAISELGQCYFAQGARDLDRKEVGEALGDPKRGQWYHSLRFRLEAEEVLSREMIDGVEREQWSYDLLAGHVIAMGILERCGNLDSLRDNEFLSALEAHPLAEDIVVGLSGALASQGVELPPLFESRPSLWAIATLAAPLLPADAVGPGSASALQRLFTERPEETLEALAPTMLTPDHPLNGRLLDELLGDLAVWERDLTWTEWIRARTETEMNAIVTLAGEWRDGVDVAKNDGALIWCSWLLTSTDKRLRDEATHALYQFGLKAPMRLFDRTLKMLSANDPAVAEGLMAASYGVAMSAQDPASGAVDPVLTFAIELSARLLDDGASQPSTHWLIREYAYRTVQLAHWLSGGDVPAPTAAAQPPLPQPPGEIVSFDKGSEEWDSVSGAFGMDFSNYTIGRLFADRSNYQEDHAAFNRVTGEIRARVTDLGWSEERFGEIDRVIGARSISRANNPEKVERYGKKYSWAGFYEAAGRLSDAGQLHALVEDGWRLSDVPIDPSFPERGASLPFELPEWVTLAGSDEDWVRAGVIEIPDELLRTTALGGGESWIAVDGYLRHEPHRSEKRKVFCFIRGFLALEGWPAVLAYIDGHGVAPELIPNNPSDYYCFAGEAPWAATFDSYATAADGSAQVQVTELGRSGNGPEVELLGIDFNWESYHSSLNDAEIGSLPSKAFAQFAKLRKVPGRAEFVDAAGTPVAKALSSSQEGWVGHILYLREDELRRYCTERGGEWGWVVWGERELFDREFLQSPPAWLSEVRRNGLDRFHRVASLAQLADA